MNEEMVRNKCGEHKVPRTVQLLQRNEERASLA